MVSANEVNTNPEDEQINLPLRRTKCTRDRQKERPRKRRKFNIVAVTEKSVRKIVPIKLRSRNAQARTKMKARQLILEANSNMENRAAASQGQSTPGTELNEETVVREKKVPVEKYLRTSTVSPTPVVTRRAMRKQKGKANMMEEVSQGQDQVTSAGIRMRVPSEKPAKVLAVSSDTKEDLVAMKTIVERVVEDVIGETAAPQKVVSSRTSTGTVILKSEKDPSAKKIQSQVLNAAYVLCGQVIPLLWYLNSKRGKYAGTINNRS